MNRKNISLTNILGNPTTDVEEVRSEEVGSIKVLRDGQLLIIRGDKTYTPLGVRH